MSKCIQLRLNQEVDVSFVHTSYIKQHNEALINFRQTSQTSRYKVTDQSGVLYGNNPWRASPVSLHFPGDRGNQAPQHPVCHKR